MSSCSWIEQLPGAATRCLVAALAAVAATPARAGDVVLPGARLRVPVESMVEARFRETVRQEHDFSCGAAAVATLLSHHYGRETRESEVFRYMWEAGDQARIEAVGFSLLDMKRFLRAGGYAADGYRIPLSELERVATPAIALVSTRGYRHFVVIQGLSPGAVLVSDPALGRRALPRSEMEEIRHAVVLLIRPEQPPARPLVSHWRLRPRAPVSEAPRMPPGLARDALLLPQFGDP